jgi:hypothetical protein
MYAHKDTEKRKTRKGLDYEFLAQKGRRKNPLGDVVEKLQAQEAMNGQSQNKSTKGSLLSLSNYSTAFSAAFYSSATGRSECSELPAFSSSDECIYSSRTTTLQEHVCPRKETRSQNHLERETQTSEGIISG